ncbi:hypothetical protein JO972_08785 [Verrucomicrobiaceae bacterium 5K15]|uniref:Uncharacterized protein n=1 Tax=Oceaniferula flava TaxID=2800421 RepID=A0AAE2SCV2_9BACT|nr:YdjY domain-containing protein [Oceaniferula flavus]MBK1855052.1 hypothetical protein [Oceaniferula flavus]MBM1136358.1 hypothetical protein [Oceaniferula flavus]
MKQTPPKHHPLIGVVTVAILLAMIPTDKAVADSTAKTTSSESGSTESLEGALKKLKLPGVHINLKEHCVDVDGEICLDEGPLELLACTKNSKEHESIIAVGAMPRHIHTALLLMGSTPGNPAMQKPLSKQNGTWVHVPPRGAPVDVFIVFKNKQGIVVERPVCDLIKAYSGKKKLRTKQKDSQFPTNTFLFAGSFLRNHGNGARKYLADMSGHVISIATFGDELLCLPRVYSHSTNSLEWQIDATHLPEVGTKVKLRLRPKVAPAPDADKVNEKQ